MAKEEIFNLLIGILKFIAGLIAFYLVWMGAIWILNNFVLSGPISKYIILPFIWSFIAMNCIFLIGLLGLSIEKIGQWYSDLRLPSWVHLIMLYALGWLMVYFIY